MRTWEVSFWDEKVEKQALSMPKGIRVRLIKLIEIMEKRGANLGLPHTRSMGQGLFEIRVKAPEGLGRFFYATKVGKQIIILHCFIKNTQETPKHHLDIARTRLKQVKYE